jgi:hypothetical protein
MRPFGHTDVLETREDIIPLESRLQKAWKRYRRKVVNKDLLEIYFESALEILSSIRPSLDELHLHLDMTSFDPRAFDFDGLRLARQLGCFLTAGYQLLPQQEIVHDRKTYLPYLGAFLEGKHLIIDGAVGASPGYEMIGDLTVNGTVGAYSGERMIGTFTFKGSFGFMFTKDGTLGGTPGKEMIGIYRTHSDHVFLGEHGQEINAWPRYTAPVSHEEFLHDIKHPFDLVPGNHCHDAAYRALRKKYGGAR